MKHSLLQWLARVNLTACLLAAVMSCSTSSDPSPKTSGSGGTASPGTSYWSRGDGQTAYLSLAGTVAKSCANGVETIGTFNGSEPSMTFVISGNTIKFPLQFTSTNTLLLGVPAQAINTNNATIYNKVSSYSCSASGSGSGSGGSGTGSGGGTGSVMFWNSSDQGCGAITVTIGSQTGTISSYYSSGAPGCGGSGCANFTLAPGTYSFSARCSRYSWSGQVTATAGGCLKMLLN